MVLEHGIQKARKKRARTGCLNCRKKHKKCDENKPICSSCLKKSEECEWPINNGRFNKNSVSNVAGTAAQSNGRQNLEEYASRLLKNFHDKSENSSSEPNSNSNTSSIFSTTKPSTDTSGSGDSVLSINQADHETLRSMMSANEPTLHHILDNNSPVNEAITNGAEPNSNERRSNEQMSGNTDKAVYNTSPFNTNVNPNESQNIPTYFSPNSIQSNSKEPNIDGSSESLRDNKSTYSFSPTDSLAPFLLYNELHSTLRDYMFTSAELNEFSTTADFNNILWSPGPTFLARDSSKNLRELLNGSTSDPKKGSNINSPALVNSGNAKVNNILNSFITELTPSEELELFKIYLYEVAPWLDMFDSSKQFGTTVADLAQSNKPLLYAIYAISSRQKELTAPNYLSEKTMKLYQESLKHLIPTVNKIVDKGIISTCVILCVLEMMSSSPKEWRHHLEGCHALFEANDISGFSDNLERRLFWCYARMDVNSAVIGEQSTIIPSENWLRKNCSIYELKRLFVETNDEDMYANYIVFICSRVLNLIAKDSKNFEQEWEFLWNEVKEWSENRPSHLKPIMTYDDKPFPGVLFLNGPAISANQLFHMAVILLTQNKPRLYKIKPSSCIVCKSFFLFFVVILYAATNVTIRDLRYGMRSRFVQSVYIIVISKCFFFFFQFSVHIY